MKKMTLLAAVAIAIVFSSCRKDRTCTCTYTNSGSANANTQITTYTKVTKKAALLNCTSGTSYNQEKPYDVQTRTCSLK